MIRHQLLTESAQALGIDKVGVAPSNALDGDRLREWLARGYQGQMSYLERNIAKRLDPSELLPGAKSVISIFVSYHQQQHFPHLDGVISKYARGEDYHGVLKDQLHELAKQLFEYQLDGKSRRERATVYRVFVDSAPVMEKEWALRGGLGWQGKHSNLITKDKGSWGFLGEIVTTEEFDSYDLPIPDYCGSCTACIDACPTQAIVKPYVVDGSRCISYGTIELNPSMDIPEKIKSGMAHWLFGCDICQDVCPWNRFARETQISHFYPVSALQKKVPDFQEMTESEFDSGFKKTPLQRPGLVGMRRNQQTTS